jgi:GAF domain-containing protein
MSDHFQEPNPTADADELQEFDLFQKAAEPEPISEAVKAALPAFAELARIMLPEQPLGAVLRRVAELGAQTIPGATEVSVTLVERGRPRTVAFAGDLAVTLDERQYAIGFGPCMDAAVTGQLISIDDTSNDPNYPEFAYQAARKGIRHTLSIGMPALQETSGALNVYGSGKPFDEAARAIATTFAEYAAVALLNAAVYAGALDEVAQMHQALASRASIEQAKGIIMAKQGCSPDEAFTVLVTMSSRTNRKLRDIAQIIVSETVSR